jgi:hypothetical protein
MDRSCRSLIEFQHRVEPFHIGNAQAVERIVPVRVLAFHSGTMLGNKSRSVRIDLVLERLGAEAIRR